MGSLLPTMHGTSAVGAFVRSSLAALLLGVALLVFGFAVAAGEEGVPGAAAPSLQSRIRGAVFGALAADALTLGSHYEYDAAKIKKAYGGKTIDHYLSPGEMMGGQTHGVGWGARNYHEGNFAGDTTDYGDYCILVLSYLAKKGVRAADTSVPMDIDSFAKHWRKHMENSWRDWMCTMTRSTLQNIQRGTPVREASGMSNAMAVRYPALYAHYDDEEVLVRSAVDVTTGLTHRNSDTLQTSEFFARVTFRIIHEGLSPREAIEQVAAKSPSFVKNKVQQALDKVAEATNPSTDLYKHELTDDAALTSMARLWEVGKSEPIKVGKASPCEGTLPGAVYFIAKYNDLAAAAAANAMVGGDNAARSIPIGMVLGAQFGFEAIPSRWIKELKSYKQANEKLNLLKLMRDEL